MAGVYSLEYMSKNFASNFQEIFLAGYRITQNRQLITYYRIVMII